LKTIAVWLIGPLVFHTTEMSEYHLDVGLLAVTEVSVVSGPRRTEEELLESATRGAKHLVSECIALPKTVKKGKFEGAAELVQLPQPVMKLPREKAPPKAKPLSAWEKFALKKGIALNRKKSNRMFDEERQEWRDKWGKRAREDERSHDWLREVKSNYVAAEDGGDPFLDERREKQARLGKQKKNEEHNRRRAELVQKTRDETAHLAAVARSLATASNGKFEKNAQRHKKH
jgi:regulator of ribosome biosynthesis